MMPLLIVWLLVGLAWSNIQALNVLVMIWFAKTNSNDLCDDSELLLSRVELLDSNRVKVPLAIS